MKFLWVLLLASALVLADDSDDGSDAGSSDSGSAVQGRTGSSGSSGTSGDKPNTRFLPGLGGGLNPLGGGGLGALLGAGQAILGGVLGAIGNPNFGGGFQPGLGGINPGFGGGFQPGFGGFGGFNQFGPGCKFTCPGPHGRFVCCGNSGFGTKPGQCPPVRPQCPNIRNFAPPSPCIVDHECSGIDKCCFDTCLQERVCKPPHGIGGFGR